MAVDKRISELPDATLPIAAGVKFEAVQGGVNVKVDADDMPGSGGVTSVNGQTGVVDLDPDYPNGLPVTDTTGTAIQFDIPKTYGSVATPETGNVTLNSTGLVKGMVQLLLHNHATTEPTWPAEFVRLNTSQNYDPGTLNIIYMEAISTARIHYTISQ